MTLDINRLQRGVDDARALLAELRRTLERERDCIAARDTEGMDRAVADKQRLFAKLDAANPARLAGLSASELEEALVAAGDEAALESWRGFLQALRETRRDNERNGVAIQRSLELVSTELGLLHGGSRRDPAVYGADGRAGGGAAGHLSTSA